MRRCRPQPDGRIPICAGAAAARRSGAVCVSPRPATRLVAHGNPVAGAVADRVIWHARPRWTGTLCWLTSSPTTPMALAAKDSVAGGGHPGQLLPSHSVQGYPRQPVKIQIGRLLGFHGGGTASMQQTGACKPSSGNLGKGDRFCLSRFGDTVEHRCARPVEGDRDHTARRPAWGGR